jgi:hypothetical protein
LAIEELRTEENQRVDQNRAEIFNVKHSSVADLHA